MRFLPRDTHLEIGVVRGLEPMSPALAGKFLTTGPLEKSWIPSVLSKRLNRMIWVFPDYCKSRIYESSSCKLSKM